MQSQSQKYFSAAIAIVVLAGVGVFSAPIGRAESNRDRSTDKRQYLAQVSDVLSILKGLPQPSEITGSASELPTDNAYKKQSLNFQAALQPNAAVSFYQEQLTALGYTEREINRATGAWGFNLVFDTPDSVNLAPTNSDKTVVLVIQGTAIGPDSININLRFDEL
ncbi:MAG: hypothetical protein AAGA60_19205 [Cyanobacteria bacterium P01_E01_bin.42]